MKKFRWTILFLVISCIAISALLTAEDEKPRIGVLRFTNQTRAQWWNSTVAEELQDMLASELVSTRAFQVLERQEINEVLAEQDLGESGRIDPATKAKLQKIKGAKYLIAGTVSASEEDTKGIGGGVNVGPISLGGSKSKSYLAVDVKVIDTETGEIVDARTIEATAKGQALGAGLNIRNFSMRGEGYEKTPTGKAIRACIVYISEYLECSLVKGLDNKCMKKWDAMDSKRREKTKDAIDIE